VGGLVMSHSEPNLISSEYILDDFDHHFKVIAGPGAGKTYWLTNHIKNVVRKSDKLNSVSKIACITYTNVAAEQILSNIGESNESVEISTIHSFLYNNIVKPYAFLLHDKFKNQLINVEKLDGHEEHIPSFGKIKSWIEKCEPRYKYLLYKENGRKLTADLRNLMWSVNSFGECSLSVSEKSTLPKELRKSILEYKKLFWNEGQIHHEDVLYFSYQILHENSTLSTFLSAKFPYIFLDEFQDTNPIQTLIVKLLADSGSIIGVIGDPAQSIYLFQGAKREDFLNFDFKDINYYKIENNRRSRGFAIFP
jgi:DNA helicase II / ATP-dependent DNA helicase PcrA